jgi:hypothetical protein
MALDRRGGGLAGYLAAYRFSTQVGGELIPILRIRRAFVCKVA